MSANWVEQQDLEKIGKAPFCERNATMERMPYLVNGQIVSEQLILEESNRLGRDARWPTIEDMTERERCLRAAAESAAVNRVLIEQIALSDPRPVDPEEAQRSYHRRSEEVVSQPFEDAAVRYSIELQLRVQRVQREFVAGAEGPSAQEIEAFYYANLSSFPQRELFRAAHIVKHVNENQSEQEAVAQIQQALAELVRGETFSETADRFSDCGGKGGDLGQFPSGHMVDEFESAIRVLEPGQRTGIFRTPFGFHIALLIERSPDGPPSLAEVRPDIERLMAQAKQYQMYALKLSQLRSRADIRVFPAEQTAVTN